MQDSNIRGLFSVVKAHREQPVLLLFLTLYPIPPVFFYLQLTGSTTPTLIKTTTTYLGIIALTLIRLAFNKLELSTGLILTRHNKAHAQKIAWILDYCLTALLLTTTGTGPANTAKITATLIAYEFLLLFNQPNPTQKQ